MHEVGIMENVIEAAVSQSQRNGFSRIHQVCLHVGEVSGVEPDALRFAFDVVASGTPAQGAQLIIERVSTVCFCESCDRPFSPDDVVYLCPQCQTLSAQVLQGRELSLVSLEVS